MISVALVSQYPIIADALGALISDAEDIDVVGSFESLEHLMKYSGDKPVHIALVSFYTPQAKDLEAIRAFTQGIPKAKVLVLSMFNDENFLLNTIKAGAKGHLANDTSREEILEAIYTVRNGHEFYARSITDILLHSYLSDQNLAPAEKENKMKLLSPRELEVLTLFAESYSNRQIAEKLFISVRTVETHKNNIMKKIELKTTVDLVKFAIKNNIIQVD
jgi:two-component system response regulator NreC